MNTCIHELPPDQCSYCKPKPYYVGPFWEAKFRAMCTRCGEIIDLGDRVRWDSEGLKTIHAKHK
jgi:hypothetical protein